MMNDYATEKVRQIELELAAQKMRHAAPAKPHAPIFGPIFRAAGRTMRRAGEGLEAWASTPAPPSRPPEWRQFHFD